MFRGCSVEVTSRLSSAAGNAWRAVDNYSDELSKLVATAKAATGNALSVIGTARVV